MPVLDDDPDSYTLAQVARLLAMPETSVRRLAQVGGGPPFIEVGGRLLYPKGAFHEWQAARPPAAAPEQRHER